LYEIRSKIVRKISKEYSKNSNKTLAIIPTRGSIHNNSNLDFQKINGKYIIDWTIESVLNSENVNKVIVSSPDKDVIRHVQNTYKEIEIHERSASQAFQNISLSLSVKEIINQPHIINQNFQALLIKTIDTPFFRSHLMDQAIDNLNIFSKIDSMIGVNESNEVFYKHDGAGMRELISSSKHRLERDTLYKKIRGFNLVKLSFFNKRNVLSGGIMGHVEADDISGFSIKNALNLKLAKTIARDYDRS